MEATGILDAAGFRVVQAKEVELAEAKDAESLFSA